MMGNQTDNAGKPGRRRLLFIAVPAAAGLILALAVMAILAGGRRGGELKPAALVLAHDIRNEALVRALDREVREYMNLFPQVSVALTPSLVGVFDAAVLPSSPGNPAAWEQPLIPWTGRLWSLAARRDVLDGLAKTMPDAVASLRSGTMDPAGFESMLAAVHGQGLSPITLGNSHGWPFVLWLEFWAAATIGPDTAGSMPPLGASPYPSISSAIADLRRWRSLGWFDTAAWPAGWAQGLAPLDEGTAVFAILGEAHFTALSPATRELLEFLPFPRRAGSAPWTVGSAMFLAIPAGDGVETGGWMDRGDSMARIVAAGTLVRYLSSPGVSGRLAKATGLPFFAWNPESGRAPIVIGAWYDMVNTPDFQALAEFLVRE